MRNIIENEKSPRKNLGSSYSKKSVEKKFSKSDVLKTNVIPGKSKFGRYQFRECKNANLRITTFLRTYNSGNFLEICKLHWITTSHVKSGRPRKRGQI